MTKRGAVRRVGNRRAWAVRFLLIALAVFLFLKAVQLHGQLDAKASEIAALEQKTAKAKTENEALEEQLTDENLDDTLLHGAYDKDHARPGDQIIVVQG